MIKKVIKFSASWCFPCKMYAKTFENVSVNEEFKNISFEEYDIEEHEELTEKYNIRSVPTTLFLDENNNVLLMVTGNITKNTLEETLRSKLNG